MSDPPSNASSVTLSLSRAEQWTLHHVLLDRLNRESSASEPSDIEPPPIEVFTAFERLDAGDTTFTRSQLSAIRPILARYHHAPAWELDRPQLERLLHRISERLERLHSAPPADD